MGREAVTLADTAAHALLLRDPAKAPPVVRYRAPIQPLPSPYQAPI